MKETNKTQSARKHIAKLTDKPIIITSLDELAVSSGLQGIEGYLGAAKENDDNIIIAINSNKPESHESTFVHELLHIMINYEGFPKVFINEQFIKKNLPQKLWALLPKLQAYFSSVLHHPVIYKRMREIYNIDMGVYFNGLLVQKMNRFNSKKNKNDQEVVFSNQQDILDGLEYCYYEAEQRTKILCQFRKKSNSAYNMCLDLQRAINKIGILNPQSCKISAEIIKSRIIKYGEKRNLGVLNNMWEALDIK